MENSKIYKLLPQNTNFHTSTRQIQDLLSIKYLLSLNFKWKERNAQKKMYVQNWKHISKRNHGASISNFGTSMEITISSIFKVSCGQIKNCLSIYLG